MSTSQGPRFRPLPVAPVPARVHPPVIEFETTLEVFAHEKLLAFRVGVDHLAELVAAARGQLRQRRQFPAVPRDVVRNHPRPPHVLRTDPPRLAFPVPELEHNERRPDFLARLQLELHLILPRGQRQGVAGVARELRKPLPRPRDNKNDALVPSRDVEIGEGDLGGPPAGVAQPQFLRWHQLGHMRFIAVGGAIVSRVVIKDKLFAGLLAETRVNRQHILQRNRRRPFILEKQRPFHGWKIAVGHALAPHHKPGSRVAINDRITGSCRINRPLRFLDNPPGGRGGEIGHPEKRRGVKRVRGGLFNAFKLRRCPSGGFGQLGR